MLKAMAICGRNQARYTKRDSWIGAAVMLVVTAILTGIGTAVKQQGWDGAAETLFSMGYIVAMAVSMPFWLTKGQPWKAQAVMIGVSLVIVILVGAMNGVN